MWQASLARHVRVLILDTYYPAFLRAHYGERPGLAERSYAEQLQSLLGRFFGTSDAYSNHLRELGHEAWDVIPNCEPLQRAWLSENGGGKRLLRLATRAPGRIGAGAAFALSRRTAQVQIEALDPDVVYCQDLGFFSPVELDRLRGDGRFVAGQIASAAPSHELLRKFDLITTSFPHFVDRFRDLGIDTEYLQIGFYERVLDAVPVVDAPREHGVVFAGGLNPNVHPGGVALVDRLVRELPLELWGYGAEQLPPDSPIRARWQGEAWGMDMYRVLADSRIVLNRHIESAEGHANNMRLFETTGMGALLITEAADNLGDLFEPGSEVVTYDSPDDLVAKVRHYLGHEDERAAIAAAGHSRTMRDHTYEKVIAELAAILEKRL